MKELDFIPEWYTANQNRRKRYHRQYVLLASLLAVMLFWSFVVGRYVERVGADVENIQKGFEKGKMKISESLLLEAEIVSLKHRSDILEAVTPRTKISCVVAELSYLIREDVILSKLSLKDEVIEAAQKKKSASTGAVVQVGQRTEKMDLNSLCLSPSRTKVVFTGIAAQPADAAKLIFRLEQSDYFEQESLVYSRPKKIKEHDVTEFEIQCFVADYKIQN